MRHLISPALAPVYLALLLFSAATQAQNPNANPHAFGIGQPASAQDLPAGPFRDSLESLPAKARGKALGILQSFAFSELDLEYLRVDSGGGVYYSEAPLPEPIDGEPNALPPLDQIPASETFLLHSRPGASNRLYLDFDGDVISGTAWNGGLADPLYAKAFDPSGDDVQVTACDRSNGTAPVWTVNFSSTELARIQEIWHRIAEDYSPWDIDVTTEDPGSFDRYTGHALFTDDADYCGDPMPSQGAGGVAYVVVFGNSSYPTSYSPALVYWTNLGGGGPTYNAEAASHEFGHNVGLAHDGTSSSSYYLGHGSDDTSPVDLTSWAPIMGAGYYRNVTQWSKGDYPGAVLSGTYQSNADDLAVITSKLGYRPDDHGDSIATADPLLVQGDGSILVTNPEDDPHDFNPENKGVIEDRNDLDFFYFDTAAGTVNITVEPAWAAFYHAYTHRGANLDIRAELFDSSGSLVDSDDPLDDTDAHLAATVPAGRYYVSVDGVGNPGNTLDPANINYGYDDYASIGEYFISGSVQPVSADTEPPNPNPMTWAVEPYSVDGSSIGMTATTASDPTGPVQYRFNCVSGGANCVSSAWQGGTSYTATGLQAGVAYTWTVQARDAVNNVTGASVERSATPEVLPPDAAPSNLAASAVSSSEIDVSWVDNSSNEDSFRLEVSSNGTDFSTLANLPEGTESYSHTGLGPEQTRFYRVYAVNTAGELVSNTDSATTDPLPPETDFPADGETLGAGSVSGTYLDTQTDGGAVESIQERQSGGRKNTRTSYLEHTWHFTINPGDQVMVHANAWMSASADGDEFAFSWSTDGSHFTSLFTLNSQSSANEEIAALPASTSGQVWLRVNDTDQTPGNYSSLDSVFVDHLFIRVSNSGPPPLPGAPSALSATAADSVSIDLGWVDNADNEAGFELERSPNGATGWTLVGEPGVNETSWTDTGLTPNTTYFYRVRAQNVSGTSAWSNTASATTPDQPPPPDISLSTSGYKVKGKITFDLSWSGAGSTSVDVYRDGTLVTTTANDGAYTDATTMKGAGSFTHQVCEAGTSTCSNVTTTVF